MPQKLSLKDAGRLFGVSAGAMRARAKKSPALYPCERDNAGKLWLLLDPERVSELQVSKPVTVGGDGVSMTPAIQGQSASALQAALAAEKVRADAAERARDQAESDRDRWRAMAEMLAAKRPRRFWPF